jgi:hypothetical protein
MSFITINFNKIPERLMATLEQFQELLAAQAEAISNIEEDVVYLKELLENALGEDGGLSEEEEAEVLTGLQAVADRLAALAVATDDRPLPPPPPPPVEDPAPPAE